MSGRWGQGPQRQGVGEQLCASPPPQNLEASQVAADATDS